MLDNEKIIIQTKIKSGIEYFKQKDFKKSEKQFKEIIEIDSNEIISNFYLGAISFEKNELDKSKTYLFKVISVDEYHRDANLMIGLIFYKVQNYKEAKFFIEKIYKRNTKDLDVLNKLSLVLIHLNEFQYAKQILHESIKLKLNSFNTFNNLGFLYLKMEKTKECIKYYSKALEINKNNPITYTNLGTAYYRIADFQNSEKIFENGLKYYPKNDYILHAYSHLQLSKCDLNKGFIGWESRKKISNHKSSFGNKTKEWQGESLDNKVICIISEGGDGDMLHYFRYLYLINKKYSTKIIFVTKKNLAHIFRNSHFDIIAEGDKTPSFDYFQYLISLPGIFYKLDKEFAKNVNFIKTNNKSLEKWKIQLNTIKGPKIGLNWQGAQYYPRDYIRSIPLKSFEKIFENNDLKFVSLVKGYGSEQIEKFKYKDRIIDFSQKIDLGENSYDDTIGIIHNLDLIISVDTSVAHLAGTMETKTWLLLDVSSDWRWGINEKVFKWYQNTTIFRQTKFLDWTNVINEVSRKLKLELVN